MGQVRMSQSQLPQLLRTGLPRRVLAHHQDLRLRRRPTRKTSSADQSPAGRRAHTRRPRRAVAYAFPVASAAIYMSIVDAGAAPVAVVVYSVRHAVRLDALRLHVGDTLLAWSRGIAAEAKSPEPSRAALDASATTRAPSLTGK